MGLAVLALAAAGTWLERGPLAERAATEWLRRRGVAATVRLTRLDGAGAEGSLVLGPPGAPTLTVERFMVAFAPLSGLAAPRVRRVELTRPTLALRFDGRRLDFGALQPLVDEATRGPPSAGPSPDVMATDARIDVATPYGPVALRGDVAVEAGRPRAHLRLHAPSLHAALPHGLADAQGLEGEVALQGDAGGRMRAELTVAAARLSGSGVAGDGVRLRGAVTFAWRSGAREPFSGPSDLEARLTADALSAPGGVALRVVEARVGGAGAVSAGRALGFDGSGTLRITAQSATARGNAGADVVAALRAGRLVVAADGTGGADVRGGGEMSLTVARGSTAMAGERAAVQALRITGRVGEARLSRGVLTGDGVVALAGSAALAPSDAARVAGRLAPGPYGADLRPALARALGRFDLDAPAVALRAAGPRFGLRLDAPARLTARGGGRLALAALRLDARGDAVTGDGAASLDGGGFPTARLAVARLSASKAGVSATGRAEVAGSAGPLRDARLALDGTIGVAAGRLTLATSRCGDVALGRWSGESALPLAQDVSGRACPDGAAPLLRLADGRWTLRTRLQGLALTAPGARTALGQGEARAAAQGAGGRVSGSLEDARASVRDLDTPLRFRPLALAGAARIFDERAAGAFEVSLVRPAHALGRMTLTQDLRPGGGGSLVLDAPTLAFAKGGLQPSGVVPALATLGRDVAGPAAARLELGWRGEATSAAVRFRTDGLQLKTAAGLVTGLKTDLVLTALAPLTSAPHQRLVADRLEALAPLTALDVGFSLGGDALTLESARADLAGGRVALDPMRIPLPPAGAPSNAPLGPMAGVVRLDGVALGPLLEAVNLSRAVSVEAKLAGALPFTLGPQGLRLVDGRLAATGPGRLTLRREALTGTVAGGAAAGPPPSAVQDFAFQALENLAFTELDATVASRPKGRLGVIFHIKGRHDPAVGGEARVGLLDLLRGHAFDKPIPLPKGTQVDLTLDTSVNLDDLLAAYGGLSGAPDAAPPAPAPAPSPSPSGALPSAPGSPQVQASGAR